MITVFLRGGLGNQMFQYVVGLQLAKKNSTPLVLDTTFLNDRFPRKEFTYRTFDLDIFTLQPQFTLLSKVSSIFPVSGLWAGIDLAWIKLRNMLHLQKFLQEKEAHVFDPGVVSATGNVLLYGYWQNEKYFSDIENEVRAAFQFRYPLDDYANQLRNEILSSESVAVCSRRGDFVQFTSARKLMGDTNLSYYDRAISYINEHVKNPRYFVFADDIEFCKKHLNLPPSTVYIAKLGPKWSFHLELMSLCKHSIIANSTFYWWGAWLNQYKNKIVIAPSRWYADREKQPEIVPKSWIKI
ncbi:alpha-1,2-fucosyltransferase [Candidatus Nomurabacteria bacterium]|nr:alpha-1,2-fucosyltransferase [Candidatus Nomurabacteria bacterium]